MAECSHGSRVPSRDSAALPPLSRAPRSTEGTYRRGGDEWLAPVHEVAKALRLSEKTRSRAQGKGPAMEHVAIDLGGTESQICVRSAEGQILEELQYGTSRLGSYLKKRPPSRVVLETCAEAFRIADTALELGHEVRVVPATLVPSLGVGARGVKTDRRDAQILSEVSTRIDLPSVHIPSETSRVWKSACTSREALVSSRTQLINSVRGWMRSSLTKPRAGGSSTFARRVRATALATSQGLPLFIDQVLVVIEALDAQIGLADLALKELATTHPVCQRLMSIPGIGPITSLRFVAALDRVDRFPNAHSVQCYLGLVPGENSSSTRKRRTGITKAGPPRVRWALAQAAWCFRRLNKLDPLVVWAAEVEKRRGKMIATTALARRLAGVMFAIWRDGTRYEPARLRSRATP
jgi:transposase